MTQLHKYLTILPKTITTELPKLSYLHHSNNWLLTDYELMPDGVLRIRTLEAVSLQKIVLLRKMVYDYRQYINTPWEYALLEMRNCYVMEWTGNIKSQLDFQERVYENLEQGIPFFCSVDYMSSRVIDPGDLLRYIKPVCNGTGFWNDCNGYPERWCALSKPL